MGSSALHSFSLSHMLGPVFGRVDTRLFEKLDRLVLPVMSSRPIIGMHFHATTAWSSTSPHTHFEALSHSLQYRDQDATNNRHEFDVEGPCGMGSIVTDSYFVSLWSNNRYDRCS